MIAGAVLRQVLLLGAGLLVGREGSAQRAATTPLEVRLGHPRGTRLLIVHVDDLGAAHSIDSAAFVGFASGLVSSGSAIVPAPYFREVASYAHAHPRADLGVHLTLTGIWKPVMPADSVRGLIGTDGRFRPTWSDTADSDTGEVDRELRAQVAIARAAGLRPTHLDSHQFILFGNGPPLFRVATRLARDEGLPLLGARDWVFGLQAPVRSLPAPSVPLMLSRVVTITPDVHADQWQAWYDRQITALPSGVSELIVHLAYDDAEMRTVAAGQEPWGAAWRARDLAYVTSEHFRRLLHEQHIALIGWRELSRATVLTSGGRHQ